MTDWAGRRIGKYEIMERVGSGGMAEVYRALHPDLQRDVAIKMIHPHLVVDPGFVDRFRREARTVAALRHPGIVQVHDFDVQGETCYMVMEFVQGESLEQRLRALDERGEWIPLDEALSIFLSVTEAVAYAHAQGVIHCDLKPSNVMLTPQDQPILTDFGLSKIVHAERLTASGTIWGTPAYMSPEQCQGKGGDAQSDVYSLGVMLYELATGTLPFHGDSPVEFIFKHISDPLPPPRSIRPDLPVALEQVIVRALEKEPANRFQSVREMLEALKRATPSAGGYPSLGWEVVRPPDVPCPYRGLEPFEAEHAEFYYGREAMIERLVARVRASSLVVVVGPSGCGKSSLVRAGLTRALRGESATDEGTWEIRTFRPGTDPVRSLAIELVGLLEPEADRVTRAVQVGTLVDHLSSGQHPMADIAASLRELHPDLSRLVLVVDQAEELYTECRDEASRQALIRSLLAASAQGIVVVLTLRADFYGRVLADRALGEAVGGGQVNVLPMSEEELQAAIEQPALCTGRTFELGLVERILADVAGEPGSLPLLQFALTGLWEQQTAAGTLTHEGYEAIGKVGGAIAQRAEAIYEERAKEGQGEIAQQIFLRLIHYGQGAGTRRRVALDELVTPRTPRSAIESTIAALADARLLVTGRDETSEAATAEVAHEALIRGWDRLRRWLDEDRAFGLWREKLAAAWEAWEEVERDEGSLLRGASLAEAEGWLGERGDDLNQVERAFIESSLALRGREAAEREARRQRELEIAQQLAETERESADKLRARNRAITAVGIMALVAFVVATLYWSRAQRASEHNAVLAATNEVVAAERAAIAGTNVAIAQTAQAASTQVVRERDEIARQGQIILARELAAQAELIQTSGRGTWNLAGLLAYESIRRGYDSAEAWAVIRRAVERLGRPVALLEHIAPVCSLAFSPDGQWVATASEEGNARVWDAATGVELARLEHDLGLDVTSVVYSPDGRWLATASGDGTARVWDLAALNRGAETGAGAELARLKHDLVIDTGQPAQVRGYVNSVAISPDGQRVATASRDNTARVWDLAAALSAGTGTGVELARLEHRVEVLSVAFSPDGQWVATTCQDQIAFVWDADTGAELARLEHDDDVTSVVFGPDGRWVATASLDGTARVWSLAPSSTGKVGTVTETERVRLEHDGAVRSVAYSPDGRQVATASEDGSARVWDLEGALSTGADTVTGSELARLEHDDGVWSAVFSPDGRRVATASFDNTARVWDAETGAELARLEHDADVHSVAFSPDGRWVATAGVDTIARVWDVSAALHAGAGVELARLGHDGYVESVTYSPDGRWVATASGDDSARVWDAWTGAERVRLEHDDVVHSLAYSPDGQRVATASRDNTARVWDVAAALNAGTGTGVELARLEHDADVSSVAYSPDGRWVATASNDHTARVWDAETGAELARLEHDADVHSVAYSPDGRWVATTSGDHTARVWDLSAALDGGTGTGAELARLGQDEDVHSVACSPDGRWVTTMRWDGSVQVWDLVATVRAGTGVELARLERAGAVQSVAYSPDGQRVATMSADGSVRVWDLNAALDAGTGRGVELARLEHDDVVHSVAFSPDGQWVATASQDGTARVWSLALSSDGNAETVPGVELARLEHDDVVSSVAFSPDGRRLATASRDHTARVWAAPESWLEALCLHLTRNLTQEEWQRYIGDEPYRKTCPDLPGPGE